MARSINPNIKYSPKKTRSADDLIKGILKGDRFVLGEVLTLVESKNDTQRQIAEEILSKIDFTTRSRNSIRLGITGSPGAGKSTFIEALGTWLTQQGKKIAVLAVDPSSTRSQGSILGDKTRMNDLSTNENAFIRPTASANVLGGVAQNTKESIAICEAAGYDIILIESVGVGQSETVLSHLVDMYLLLLLPGGGDGVQGIKRGVVEMADMLIINKNDGDQRSIAQKSKKDFASAIQLFHHPLSSWRVPVSLCSSLDKTGIDEIWKNILDFVTLSKSSNHFYTHRQIQDQEWLKKQTRYLLTQKTEELFDLHLTNDENQTNIFVDILNSKKQIEAIYNNLKKK